MSVNAVDQTTGNTTPLAGNTNNLVGNLSALTTNTKSDAVGAINEVNQTKQNATDNNLQTTDKTIVGGINELRSGLIKKTHYTLTTDNDGDVAINVSVGNIVAIIPDRSKGDDGCYTSWFTGIISTNTSGTFYSIKFVDATLAKIASTKIAFDVLYT